MITDFMLAKTLTVLIGDAPDVVSVELDTTTLMALAAAEASCEKTADEQEQVLVERLNLMKWPDNRTLTDP